MRTWRDNVGDNVGQNAQGDYWPAGGALPHNPAAGPMPFTLAAYAHGDVHHEYAAQSAPAEPRRSVVIPAVTLPSVATPTMWRISGTPRVIASSTSSREPEGWLIREPGQASFSQYTPSPRAPGWQDAPQHANDPSTGWSGDQSGRPPPSGNHHRAGHVVQSAVADPHASADDGPLPDLDYIPEPEPAPHVAFAPRPANHRLPLGAQDRLPSSRSEGRRPARVLGISRRISRRGSDIVVIPAHAEHTRHVDHTEHTAHATRSAHTSQAQPIRRLVTRMGSALGEVARRPVLVSILTLAVVLLAALVSVTGAAQQAGVFSASAWHSLAGDGTSADTMSSASTPSVSGSAALVAPQIYDTQHYMDKYGFFQPGAPSTIAADKMARLTQMLPAAIKATTAYNKRYGQSVEPQLLLYWTYSEGISARINYSDCANEPSPPGKTYFTDIENCDHASFWQLGYGNQFGVIYVLRNAFADLYGDPNDTQLVAKVGQSVLDFDTHAGTTPPCGGYSCTFPAKTIDEILSGVDLTTGVKAEDNWWASVLSRDPLINCYMIAHALTYFTHDATRNWVGCYYTTTCWQRDSDKLGDILAAWPDLVKAAGIQG